MQLHAAPWPGVLAALGRANIVDYSIHHFAPLQLLVATFKYVGVDWDADMKKIAEDPETQRWWKLTDGMQESFNEGAVGSGGDIPWWTVSFNRYSFAGSLRSDCQDLPEVFRFDGRT